MQESEEKERDWYGYAKYLETTIEQGAMRICLIRFKISDYLMKSAEDAMNGKGSALHLCESLSMLRDIHESLINLSEKLKLTGHRE